MIVAADYKGNKEAEAMYKRLAIYLGRYTADQRFLLGICAVLNADMALFKRGYEPPKNIMQQPIGMPFVSNADKFLDFLPTLSAKE